MKNNRRNQRVGPVDKGFVNSLIKLESAHMLLFAGVLISFTLFWQIKNFFMTREEGVAVEKRVDSIERSVSSLSDDIKSLERTTDDKLSRLRLELKGDISEGNKQILNRLSEVTDRLINKINQAEENVKELNKKKSKNTY